MDANDANDATSRVPFLRSLSVAERERIAPLFEITTLGRGESFWTEGQPSERFAFVIRGQVKFNKVTRTGRDAVTGVAGPGELLCASAVCAYAPHCCASTSLEDGTEILSVPRRELLELFERSPGVARALLAEVIQRGMRTCERVEELSSGQVEQRICAVLAKLSDRIGIHRQGEGTWIPVALSRQDLADMCGTTIETAIRTMSRLRKNAIVRTTARGFVVIDRARLEELSRGNTPAAPGRPAK
jgi:CRP/FNR family transcriptional regulator